MKDFYGKVAVVTGAASGIGRALAAKCAALGMKVVLAGIEESTLKQAEIVFDAIHQEQFYILTESTIKQFVQRRMEDILQERTPTVSLGG